MAHPKDRPARAGGQMSRREFLQRAAAAGIAMPTAAAILAACNSGSNTTGGPSGGIILPRPDHPVTWPIKDSTPMIPDGRPPEKNAVLKIFGYVLYIKPAVQRAFESKYNCKIDYTVFDTPDQMVSKMQSGASDFDFINSVTLENIGVLIQGDLVQPINHSYVPNFSQQVWKTYQDPFYDRGSRYSMVYTVYTTGIGYRNDLVKTDIASMDNPYDIFWDTTYTGKVHLLNGSRDPLCMALMKNGIADINTEDPKTLDIAKNDLLKGVQSMGWKFDHVDYNEIGQWDVHHTWSGQVAYYQYYLPKGVDIKNFTYVWPPKGTAKKPGIITNDVWMIPKTAKNPVLAHALLNFMYDPKNAIPNYVYEGYQPPMHALVPDQIVAKGYIPKNLANIIITEEDFPLGLQELQLTPAGNQLWQRDYQQITAGA